MPAHLMRCVAVSNKLISVNDIVDLGPFEFGSGPVECEADIVPVNGNGTVDVDDLLLVINSWESTGKNPADVTGNGVVMSMICLQ